MPTACRRFIAAFLLLASTAALAAPYPSEEQLRQAARTGAALLQPEGIPLVVVDAEKEGLSLPILAAGLNLDNGTCVVFFNAKPRDSLVEFFAAAEEKDLPVWLAAIAAHEATHCIEQREGYLRQRFAKVLPPGIEPRDMTVQGYLSVVKSGAVQTWGEALADIASILYLKQAEPARWRFFAKGIADLRHDYAHKWPAHDTSGWLYRLIAADPEVPGNQSVFETAFQLRRELRPGVEARDGEALAGGKG